ncbi:MAG: hypothetical protein AAF361_15700 [Bacteroidota bacterium]
MKTTRILFTLFMLLGTVTYFSSCEKDPCEDVVCQNGGTCDEGTCACVDGYEGTDCSTLSADKFVGTYSVSGTCEGIAYNYTVSISKSATDPTMIIIDNFGDLNCAPGYAVEAIVDGDTFTLTGGPYCEEGFNDFTGYSFVGTGTINGNVITCDYMSDYTFQGTAFPENCSVTMTK